MKKSVKTFVSFIIVVYGINAFWGKRDICCSISNSAASTWIHRGGEQSWVSSVHHAQQQEIRLHSCSFHNDSSWHKCIKNRLCFRWFPWAASDQKDSFVLRICFDVQLRVSNSILTHAHPASCSRRETLAFFQSYVPLTFHLFFKFLYLF